MMSKRLYSMFKLRNVFIYAYGVETSLYYVQTLLYDVKTSLYIDRLIVSTFSLSKYWYILAILHTRVYISFITYSQRHEILLLSISA